MYPFERFTDAAKEMLSLAQLEAENARSSYIGPEHLLIALVSQRDTVAGVTLGRIGVVEEHVRASVAAIVGAHERMAIQHIKPTSPVKRVVELSFEEARRAGSPAVATDHVLLGLLADRDHAAAHILVDAGASEESVRAVAAQVREDGMSEPSTGTRPQVSSSKRIARPSTAWVSRVITGANAEANADLADEVTDAHLLRHVLRSQDARVRAGLHRLGVDAEALITALRPPDAIIELRRALRAAGEQKGEAVGREDFAAADVARRREDELRQELAEAEAAWLRSQAEP